jgi:large subunit ribosomal protein L35
MPKIKTNKSASKRFKITGSGKIKRRRANRRHILVGKGPGRRRRLRSSALINKADHKRIKKLLPNG